MSASSIDISVIICTRDRAESLRETLQGLAGADRTAIAVEIVVVDNGSVDMTRQVVESFGDRLVVRYFYEPLNGPSGKGPGVNRVFRAGGLGVLVAVLDDDMSVSMDWFQGVRAIARRWPDADVFTGNSYVIWPFEPVPEWAKQPEIQGWIFSVNGCGSTDQPLASGMWFSGNHFWFRSRVLHANRCFAHSWLPEPMFILGLVEEGKNGVCGPDASAGHRVQRHLLNPEVVLQRAELVGRTFATVRLCPCRSTVRNARWARNHRVLAKVGCAGLWIKWSWRCWRLRNVGDKDVRFAARLVAVERRANYREVLNILWTSADYQVLPWPARSFQTRPLDGGRRHGPGKLA